MRFSRNRKFTNGNPASGLARFSFRPQLNSGQEGGLIRADVYFNLPGRVAILGGANLIISSGQMAEFGASAGIREDRFDHGIGEPDQFQFHLAQIVPGFVGDLNGNDGIRGGERKGKGRCSEEGGAEKCGEQVGREGCKAAVFPPGATRPIRIKSYWSNEFHV